MEEVSNPQISPDGKQIVYTRRWIDKLKDKWESALWMMNADGSRNRLLVKGSSPQWAPDGTRIAYLADGEPKGTQIFVRGMNPEDTATQITRVKQAPSNMAWSPDGQWIAFTMLVPKKESWDIRLPGKPEGAEWTKDPRVIERLVYRRDRIGFLDEGYFHIFRVPVTGGTPQQLTEGDSDHGGGPGFAGNISWTPDGSEIIYSTLRTEDWEYPWRTSEVYALNVRSKTVRRLTKRDGPDHNPAVSPNGRWVAYTGYDWTDDSYIISEIYVVGIDGSNPRPLTSNLDRSVYSSPYGSPTRNFWWATDSTGVYFNVNDLGTSNLHFVNLQGQVTPVTKGNHILTVTDISRSGQAVGRVTSYYKPANLITFTVAKPELRQLTFANAELLKNVKLGEVEEIWYTSVENYRIQGWLIKPPDFDPQRKYPLILSIHGGPHGMYGVGFDFAWQNHAAEGYVVLYLNPRGSTGYGGAFGNAIKNAYPGKDFDDLMKGVDEVIARGYVDQRNLFVYGCSGGGVLTAWIVGHTNRFAAASSNCAVIDWLSFVGTTDGVSFNWTFKKLPWEDPTEHLMRSPLMYVNNVTTPTMLMTGELDLNTPIGQAEQFYRALKLRGVPTAMVRFQEEWHGTTSKPSNFLRTQLYLRYWFRKHAGNGRGGASAEPAARQKIQ